MREVTNREYSYVKIGDKTSMFDIPCGESSNNFDNWEVHVVLAFLCYCALRCLLICVAAPPRASIGHGPSIDWYPYRPCTLFPKQSFAPIPSLKCIFRNCHGDLGSLRLILTRVSTSWLDLFLCSVSHSVQRSTSILRSFARFSYQLQWSRLFYTISFLSLQLFFLLLMTSTRGLTKVPQDPSKI